VAVHRRQPIEMSRSSEDSENSLSLEQSISEPIAQIAGCLPKLIEANDSKTIFSFDGMKGSLGLEQTRRST
jgi:hypothetical protein